MDSDKKYPCSCTLPLYRHKWLYEWSDRYQEHKFFTEEDLKEDNRLDELRIKGLNDYVDKPGQGEIDQCEPAYFSYKQRYNTLKQDTVFCQNLMKIEDIEYKTSSYSELVLKCEAAGISARKVNFMLLYYFFCPGRIFAYSFDGMSEEELADKKAEWAAMRGPSGDIRWEEADYYRQEKFRQMRKEAFGGKRHDCATYEEFVETRL